MFQHCRRVACGYWNLTECCHITYSSGTVNLARAWPWECTGDILKLVVGHALRLVTGGVVLGLAVSIAIADLLKSLLFGVEPTDIPTFIGVSVLLAALALIVCRAGDACHLRVDPLVVLKTNNPVPDL